MRVILSCFMNQSWLYRPRATVKIVPGKTTSIGRTKSGKVGVVSTRYEGVPVIAGEVWLVDVVHDAGRYFIMIPIERVHNAA